MLFVKKKQVVFDYTTYFHGVWLGKILLSSAVYFNTNIFMSMLKIKNLLNMKNYLSLALLGLIAVQTFAQLPYLNIAGNDTTIDVAKYKDYINNHLYATRTPLLKEDIKKMDKQDRPDLAYEHDWLMTHDPIDGQTHWERLIPVLKQMNNSKVQTVAPGGTASNKWTERGPNDVGGRVRALMFDPTDNTNKKVFAGGIGGGLWYNTDITSNTSSWIAINDFWSNLAVSAITYDPTSTSTFYVGTGEGFGNSDAIRGAGIWRSTNKGSTWAQLTATNNTSFNLILDSSSSISYPLCFPMNTDTLFKLGKYGGRGRFIKCGNGTAPPFIFLLYFLVLVEAVLLRFNFLLFVILLDFPLLDFPLLDFPLLDFPLLDFPLLDFPLLVILLFWVILPREILEFFIYIYIYI